MVKKVAAKVVMLGVLGISLFGLFLGTGATTPVARADGGCFSWNGIFIHASNCWNNGYPGVGYGTWYPGPYYPPIVYPPPPPPPPPIPIGYGPPGPCGCPW